MENDAERSLPPVAAGSPSPADDDANDLRLGKIIRLLRQRMQLSIQELGQRTGLSVGMISQMERGLSTPSVRTLRLLALTLQVPISFFFEERMTGPAPRYIVRRAHRRMLRLTASGVLKESLAPDTAGQMEMFELTLSPNGSSGADFVQHGGEKAGYVLSGTLRLWLDHEAHLLETGDSFRFPSMVPHMFDNPTTLPTRIVWITASSDQAHDQK